ncbi:MAG: shikimate dehydrogenase [Chthoniobacterales bacterium]|nr:MAG: shikimate dehydrogenase [Chthoniobacterales bacterium]
MKDTYTLDDLKNWDAKPKSQIRLGIFGDPVAHSLSPQMQNAALEKLGLKERYARFQIGPEELQPALELIRRLNFVGINLTLPHKAAALSLLDGVDDGARKTGAVNTVLVEGEKLVGFNTDGAGFLHAIRTGFSVDLRDLRVLLLGAGGGAGRAIAVQCALENCERLVLVNRTFEKAKELAAELAPHFAASRVLGPVARLQAVPWDEAVLRFQLANTDLVINATSVGMQRSDPPLLPASLLAPHLMVYDTIYHPSRTPLLAGAEAAGAKFANGLTMLLHQGALSFELWFDRKAPIDAMRAALPFT